MELLMQGLKIKLPGNPGSILHQHAVEEAFPGD